MKKGFTLVEMLVVVMIIGILSSMALPNYMRSIEKSRATEAMTLLKSLNDAVYAYSAEKSSCPPSFSKLLIEVPGTKVSDTEVRTKYFAYKLNAATAHQIPGTGCPGVVAQRLSGDIYRIWNPYGQVSGGQRTLACNGDNDRAIAICKSMNIYTSSRP